MDLYADLTDWRLEKIVHIKSIINSGGATDDFEEFVEELDADSPETKQIFEKLPFIGKLFDPEEDDCWPDCATIMDQFLENPEFDKGFFIQVACQIPTYHDENSWSSSWGYYTRQWIYTSTIEEAEQFASELSEKTHLKAMEKFKNAKK